MKRRTFLLGLLTLLPIAAHAKGGSPSSGGRRYKASGGYGGGSGGGNSGGCGSRGGPGYRKANGRCASWKD